LALSFFRASSKNWPSDRLIEPVPGATMIGLLRAVYNVDVFERVAWLLRSDEFLRAID